jgi:hypothetical protein
VAEFDKAMTVAKLKGARDRVRRRTGKCEGRKSYAERDPALVAKARELGAPINARGERELFLRKIAVRLASEGYVTPSGSTYSASAIKSMLSTRPPLTHGSTKPAGPHQGAATGLVDPTSLAGRDRLFDHLVSGGQ